MGKGDPETAIGIADVQERMETALVDFEEQATAFRTKNKVKDFKLILKILNSDN